MIYSNDILKLTFSYNEAMAQNYRYAIEQMEGYYQLRIDKQIYENDVRLGSTTSLKSIDFIIELLNQYKIEKWDGFREESLDCDGEGFQLRITLNDKCIFAQGNNCFPEGFFDFKKQLDKVFEQYMAQED